MAGLVYTWLASDVKPLLYSPKCWYHQETSKSRVYIVSPFLLLRLFSSAGAEYCDKHVCLSVCLSVCLNTPPLHARLKPRSKFHQIFGGDVFTRRSGSVVIWWRCNALCTSGLVVDVMLSYYGFDCSMLHAIAAVSLQCRACANTLLRWPDIDCMVASLCEPLT